MMIGKVLIAFSVFFLCSTSSDIETISWSESFKLTWHHFKGKPNRTISAAAVTASGITFEFAIKETETRVVGFETKVFAHFYPEKSWYVKELGDQRILAHEQLHFDITELYARKFRKQISELKLSSTIKSELKTLHKNINEQLDDAQNKYDSETDNSMNIELQSKWVAYVNNELRKLEDYKSKE